MILSIYVPTFNRTRHSSPPAVSGSCPLPSPSLHPGDFRIPTVQISCPPNGLKKERQKTSRGTLTPSYLTHTTCLCKVDCVCNGCPGGACVDSPGSWPRRFQQRAARGALAFWRPPQRHPRRGGYRECFHARQRVPCPFGWPLGPPCRPPPLPAPPPPAPPRPSLRARPLPRHRRRCLPCSPQVAASTACSSLSRSPQASPRTSRTKKVQPRWRCP